MGEDHGRQPAYWLYHRKPAEWVLATNGSARDKALCAGWPLTRVVGWIRGNGALAVVHGQPVAPILLVLAALRAEGQLPPDFPAIWVEEG